jgi:hypothetical protein
VLYTDDRLSRFLCAWFLTFLVLDLAVGVLDYPKDIGMLTGWVHHTAYIIIMT